MRKPLEWTIPRRHESLLGADFQWRKNNEEDELGGSAVDWHAFMRSVGGALPPIGLDFVQHKGSTWVWLGIWEHNNKAQ